MTDEQYGGIGCLAILLIIGVCCLHFSSEEKNLDVYRKMDEFVQKTEHDALRNIMSLKQDYAKNRKERENAFRCRAEKLLNQIEIEQRRVEAEKRNIRENELKESELRAFALKESPGIWKTVQLLKGEIGTLSDKIKKLEATLRQFGKDPKVDEDVVRIRDYKEQLKVQLSLVKGRLETAYLASKKYEALPQRREFNDLMRKSLEDGVSSAEMAEQRYKELKEKEQ